MGSKTTRKPALPGVDESTGYGLTETLSTALEEQQGFFYSRSGRIAMACIAVMVALVSFFPLAGVFSDPDFWAGTATVTFIKNKCNAILTLIGSSAGASMALAAVPGDMTTPIATKLADVSADFSTVLAVLFMEKYLLPIFGMASFKFLIPAGCVLFLIQAVFPIAANVRSRAAVLSAKVVVFALVLVVSIPGGMHIANVIESTHDDFKTSEVQASIDDTVEEGENGSLQDLADVQEASTDQEEGNPIVKLLNDAGKALNSAVNVVSDSLAGVTAWVSGLIEDLIEALVILIVTSCVIPILVFVLLLWFVNILFGLHIQTPGPLMSSKLLSARKKRERQGQVAE